MDDAGGFREWAQFLTTYAQGEGWSRSMPLPPALPQLSPVSIASGKRNYFDPDQVYHSINITVDEAKLVCDYIADHDFMPPPRSPLEALREKCILDYDLYSKEQTANIQSAVNVIAAFFPGTLCTFTLFVGRKQSFFAIGGSEEIVQRYQVAEGNPIFSETSLCGHSIMTTDLVFVPTLSADWRFRSNPYTKNGIQSYIGSSVSLRSDPAGSDTTRISVGVLNILFVTHPHLALTEQEEMVVLNLSRMLETQLRATWEGNARTREAKEKKLVADMIEKAFVREQLQREWLLDGVEVVEGFPALAELAVARLKEMLPDLESIAVVDSSGTSIASTHDLVLGPISFRPDRVTFEAGSTSGLEPGLPPGTLSHLVIPFFSADQPLFILLATCPAPHFPPLATRILRTIGCILLARAVQSRVVESDRAKTTFLSSISHELRTPMHSIMTGLGLIEGYAEAEDWEQCRSILKVVRSSGLSLQNILNDVLDFSRIESGVRRTAVDLIRATRQAAKMCLSQFDDCAAGFSLAIEYEERDWMVQVDEAKFNRIVINGLTNALKFCKDAPIVILLRQTESIVVTIRDQGIGFDESVVPHLLEPFTKQDTHSPGAGLGLYITKRVVESLGGSLTLRSTVGKGTTFQLSLPASSSMTPAKAEIIKEILSSGPVISTPPRAPSPSAAGLRVLVVDDNAICRRLLTMSLKKGRFKVNTAQAVDGQDAVEKFQSFRPDVVLTDVSMPVMDGITAARKMREAAEGDEALRQCRIYAITGLGSSDPRLKAAAIGGDAALDGWLVKGQDDVKVIEKILEEVELSRRIRAI